ncbi:hypothetical protein HPB47_004782, partial [Ixodes persulcatus]
MRGTVASLLQSLSVEESANNQGLPLSPMHQLFVDQIYGAGTFQVVTGDLVNVPQNNGRRVLERVSRLFNLTLFNHQ